MKVLIAGLIYGNRPHNIIFGNLLNAGYEHSSVMISREGISNALNDGIDEMMKNNFDAIAFLSNDIKEPDNWLAQKVKAIQTYPDAAVVASSIHEIKRTVESELIIGNWLTSKATIEKVGYFNEDIFPYGPIDLDYCERCIAAGLKTYYVVNCHAVHDGSHATGTEYGWDKDELVKKFSKELEERAMKYKSGELDYYIPRHEYTINMKEFPEWIVKPDYFF